MKGNINTTVEIKEEDRYFYNVLMEKRIVDPRDPLHPIVRQYLKVFRIKDYEKYFKCSQEDQIGFLKAMNYQAAELVHDPTYKPVLRIEPIDIKVIPPPKAEAPPVREKSAEQVFIEERKATIISPMDVKIRKPSRSFKRGKK